MLKFKVVVKCEMYSEDYSSCIETIGIGTEVEYLGHLVGGNILIVYNGKKGIISGLALQ